MSSMGKTPLCVDVNVSRETIDSLHAFDRLVVKWNRGVNLISKASLPHLWERHIIDSAQLFHLAGGNWHHWADLGSGGGFPGIVIATLAKELRPDAQTTLVESDQRKATFLRTAVRELGLNATVICDRIEKVEPLNADIVSARALTDLTRLMPLAARHLSVDGLAIFPKGEAAQSELDLARLSWRFDLTETPSITHPNSRVIMMRGIARA